MLFRLSEIYKSYSAHEILRGVSFQINPNEKVGLVGRNGAGKTTVFRLITGEEAADAGEVVKINNLKLGLLEQHVDFTENETVHTAALCRLFKRLHDIEAEMRRLEIQMAENVSDEVLEQYAELQNEFEHEDGFTYTARAEAILLGLGFAKETWTTETKNLSGGQKNRLGLGASAAFAAGRFAARRADQSSGRERRRMARKFFADLRKNFCASSATTVIFSTASANRIIEIENGKAVSYKGNYSRFSRRARRAPRGAAARI